MKLYLIAALLISCQTISCQTMPRNNQDLYYLQTSSSELSDSLILGLQGVKDALLTELVQHPNDSKVLYNLAQASFMLGEYNRSAMYCHKILRMNIDFDPAKVILAKVFLRQQKLELAEILADQLQDEALRTNLKAQIYIAKGDYSQAIQILKEKAAKHLDATDLHMNLGLLYLKFKQLRAAETAFQQVLQYDGKHAGALLHLATIYSKRGNFSQADTIYRQLISRRAKDPQLLFNMLVLSKRQRHYSQAAALLLKHEKLLTRYAEEELHDKGKKLVQALHSQLKNSKTSEVAIAQ